MNKYLKLTASFLSLILLFSLCGCGDERQTASESKKNTSSNISSSSESSGEDTSSDEEVSSAQSTQQISSDISYTPSDTASSDVTSVEFKAMTAAQGVNYLMLRPKQNHPGVAEMDATYEFILTDKLGNNIFDGNYTLSTNDSSVKINGNKITVPWALRKSGKALTVTATLKSNKLKKGAYTFNFKQYTDNPTFFDDFNTLNTDVWIPASDKDVMGVVENGNLVFAVNGEGQKRYEMMTKEFKQAYGCFTARIDMPKNGNGNAAFWMMTTDGDRYIKNPAMPSQSNGEIDIVEYFGTWKNRWSAALHWFAWNPNYLCSSGDDKLPAEDIQKGYHNFSAVWTDSAIYWYYDGELARVYEGDGVAKGSAGMRLLIQLAPEYKDGWGGTYDPTDYPYQMKTDYIKAYQFK